MRGNKVKPKEEGKKYSLIPKGYEERYERWLLIQEQEEIRKKRVEFNESLGSLEEPKESDEKRVSWINSVKVNNTGNAVLFKKQKADSEDLRSIVMKFIQAKDIDLNDGVKIRLDGKNSVVIKYRDKDGKIVTEKISISHQSSIQEEKY